MKFGVNEGIALGGAVMNGITGRSAMKAQKEAMRRQTQLLNMQNQTYRAAQPGHLEALKVYAGRAGLGADGVQQTGPNRFGLGGNFGDEADQMRFLGAQEDIDRLARMRGNQLQATMARRGIAGGSQAAALAGNERAAMGDLTRFRRQLAINAGQEQERRLAQYLAATAQAMGQGSQAIAGYGQQGQVYGQQANQAFGGIGQIVSDWQQRQAMEDYLRRQGGGIGGGYPGPTSPAPWSADGIIGRYQQPTNWWDQIG